MTKARDLANIISGGFTVDDLPTLTANEIPNLDAAKITSGTFADARIAASNVSQHATSFDDNKLVNDISTLGLRVHTQENLNASNTNSASFDVFQDSSGITNLTNSARNSSEFVSSITSADSSVTINNSNYTTYINSDPVIHHANTSTFSGWPNGNYSTITNYGTASNAVWASGQNNDLGTKGARLFSTSTSTDEWLLNNNVNSGTSNYYASMIGLELTQPFAIRDFGVTWRNGSGSFWTFNLHQAINSSGIQSSTSDVSLGSLSLKSGNSISNGTAYLSSSDNSNYGHGSNTTKVSYLWFDVFHYNGTNGYKWNSLSISGITSVDTVNATGSFEGATITAGASTSKMGAVITYQDNAGTNTLNTDIVLKLSADNGSNYSTATLTALPDFATGIKMAKVNDLSVTAGTQLKYKLEFANQASGSKEARIRGVSLQY
jgi:hypothetical protein